jgi:hypothetical protein
MICDEFDDEFWLFCVHLRCQNSLKRHNIKSFAELTKMTKRDLLKLNGVGKKAVQEIVEALAEKGLALSTGPEDHYRWVQMGKQVNQQLKGLANMKEEFNNKESETEEQSTWMERTGGYARDMTLHQWYAGLALQSAFYKYLEPSEVARYAFELADAMLEEREAK